MENMDAKGNDRKHYRGIEKQTDNPFLNLYHIDALGRDGTPFHYYFASRNDENNIKHKTHSMRPEGMAVYAVTEDGEKLVLVRQYRYPVNDYLYELPAGLIEPEETASEAACREMIEETGWKLEVYEGGEPAFRRGFFLAQGLTDESGSMIFGTVTENVGQQMENTEDIQVILADRQEVLRILRQELRDSSFVQERNWTDADAVFEDRTGSTVCFFISVTLTDANTLSWILFGKFGKMILQKRFFKNKH